MKRTTLPRVKICCIQSENEAQMAIQAGASALGFVSEMPSGPGVISKEDIARIVSTVPPPVATFLLTSKQDVSDIVEQQKYCGTNTIQLVDQLVSGTHIDLKQALPGVAVVQVIHVTGEESVEEALSVAEHVDAILLDSGNPSLQVKELGGTGRKHDWSISRKIVEALDIPVFLAGGLKPGNVAEAIEHVIPFGVDVCSGVRKNGKLDAKLLKDFFASIRNV